MGITTMQRSICWLLTWQKSVLALKRRKQKNENTRRAPPEGPRGPVDDRSRSNALLDLLGRYGICLLGHGEINGGREHARDQDFNIEPQKF